MSVWTKVGLVLCVVGATSWLCLAVGVAFREAWGHHNEMQRLETIMEAIEARPAAQRGNADEQRHAAEQREMEHYNFYVEHSSHRSSFKNSMIYGAGSLAVSIFWVLVGFGLVKRSRRKLGA